MNKDHAWKFRQSIVGSPQLQPFWVTHGNCTQKIATLFSQKRLAPKE